MIDQNENQVLQSFLWKNLSQDLLDAWEQHLAETGLTETEALYAALQSYLGVSKQGRKQAKRTSPGYLEKGLRPTTLAKRLGIDKATLDNWSKRNAQVLSDCTQFKDPDGLAWKLTNGKYYPMFGFD